MKRERYLLGLVLLSCLLLCFPCQMTAQHRVTMTTAHKVGDLLDRDDFWVNEGVEGDYTIDGLTKINSTKHRIDKQDIVITGVIKKLNCGDIKLTKLDVSGAPELVELDCRGNQLSSLEVRNNTKLHYLACGQKGLRSIDLSTLSELSFFNCSRSPISQLDLKNNTKLKSLYAFECELSNLDLSSLKLLATLYCNGNKLTKLDVSANPNLENLICGNNQIKNLDLTKNDKLGLLSCTTNGLERLLLSNRAFALQGLNISSNKLNKEAVMAFIKSLPMQQGHSTKMAVVNTEDPDEMNVFTSLHVLMMSLKGWSAWDFKGGLNEEQYAGQKDDTPYIILQASSTPAKIETLELDATGDIHRIGVNDEGTSIEVKYAMLAGKIKGLKVKGARLAGLDLSHNPMLERMDCSNNKITELNLSASTQLKELICSHNHLRQIDVKPLAKLEVLECASNQLSALGLENNLELKKLRYEDNQIRHLDLSKQSKLRYLQNYQNAIDLAAMTALVDQLPLVNAPEEGLLCPVQVKGRNAFNEELHSKARAKGWRVVMADEQGKHKQYTSTESIEAAILRVQYDPAHSLLQISGGTPNGVVSVCTMDGRRLAHGHFDAYGYWSSSLSAGLDLQHCIVRAGHQTLKIATQ